MQPAVTDHSLPCEKVMNNQTGLLCGENDGTWRVSRCFHPHCACHLRTPPPSHCHCPSSSFFSATWGGRQISFVTLATLLRHLSNSRTWTPAVRVFVSVCDGAPELPAVHPAGGRPVPAVAPRTRHLGDIGRRSGCVLLGSRGSFRKFKWHWSPRLKAERPKEGTPAVVAVVFVCCRGLSHHQQTWCMDGWQTLVLFHSNHHHRKVLPEFSFLHCCNLFCCVCRRHSSGSQKACPTWSQKRSLRCSRKSCSNLNPNPSQPKVPFTKRIPKEFVLKTNGLKTSLRSICAKEGHNWTMWCFQDLPVSSPSSKMWTSTSTSWRSQEW